MTGGPSQMDLFDPKPLLNRLDGQPLPPSFGKIHSQFLESDPLCLGSHRKWGKYGQSGMDMSDLVPHMHPHADEIALIRSCVADSVIHAPAMYQMNTGPGLHGLSQPGKLGHLRPGLRERRPAGVRRDDPARGDARRGRALLGRRLPARASPGDALPQRAGRRSSTSSRPTGSRSLASAATLDLLRSMNEEDLDPADTELSARIASYELAFRMQSAAPEAVDLSREPESTAALYGLDDPRTAEFGTRCLLARRLVERGVRFVQLYSGGGPVAMQWDAHDDLDANHEKMCGLTDKPVAALLTDLKRTGPARRDPGRLGRRVRPDAGPPGGRPRPRPQRHRLHHVDGRRRRQGGYRSSAPPTRSASRPSRTAPTSTTSTPRSCT